MTGDELYGAEVARIVEEKFLRTIVPEDLDDEGGVFVRFDPPTPGHPIRAVHILDIAIRKTKFPPHEFAMSVDALHQRLADRVHFGNES